MPDYKHGSVFNSKTAYDRIGKIVMIITGAKSYEGADMIAAEAPAGYYAKFVGPKWVNKCGRALKNRKPYLLDDWRLKTTSFSQPIN